MKKELTIILGLILYCIPTFGQLTLKEFKFDSWFGYELNSNTETETVYCLLGTGFFRATRADNTDSLISAWTSGHPAAVVIPVYTMGDSEESRIIYSWVVDKSDTLNIILVRQGCVPGGTMQRPETWKKMTRKERKLYDNNRPVEEVHIDEKTYKDFLDKVVKAEEEAKKKKLGIWSEEND